MNGNTEQVTQMYTSKEVIEKLGINKITLMRWRKDGKIAFVEFPRKQYRYAKAEIEKILREGL